MLHYHTVLLMILYHQRFNFISYAAINILGTCSWESRWCWPGKCSSGLAKDCTCAQGFRSNIDGTEAVCECTYLYIIYVSNFPLYASIPIGTLLLPCQLYSCSSIHTSLLTMKLVK